MLSVLPCLAMAMGLPRLMLRALRILAAELSNSVSDEGISTTVTVAGVNEQLLSKVLPGDRNSAAACFPIGVLALKVPDDKPFEPRGPMSSSLH